MFLLASLLAALADGASAREARAAGHELRQRLLRGPEVPAVEVPPIGEMMLRIADLGLQHGEPWAWSALETRTARIVRRLYPVENADSPLFSWLYLDAVDRLLYRYHPKFLMGKRVLFPTEDLNRPDTPHVRGPPERDALLYAYVGSLEAWARASQPDTMAADAFLNDLPSILDWVEATHPALTTLTLPRIMALSHAWHDQFKSVGFGAPLPDAWVVLRWPDGWTLQRLTEKKDLALEGESMAHCVGGPPRANGRRDGESAYWQAVRDGRDTIFSLRTPSGHPVATLQGTTGNTRIVQVQGPEDEAPQPGVRARLIEALWALGVFRTGLHSGQPVVHNVGTSRVWADDDAYGSRSIERALGWLDTANADLARVRRGTLHKEAIEHAIDRTLHYVVTFLTQLQGETSGENPFILPRSRLSRTHDRFWWDGQDRPLENPTAVLIWDGDEAEVVLRMIGEGDRFQFYLGTREDVGDRVGENLLDGIRALMGWTKTPPDVSAIEMLAPRALIWSGDLAAVRKARAEQRPLPRPG